MSHERPAGEEAQRNPGIIAGPLDAIIIYHRVDMGTYHPAYYQEHSLPGATTPFDQVDLVRLKSFMHHTAGAATLEGAQALVTELRQQIEINDLNVNAAEPVAWSGEIGDMILVANWRKRGTEHGINPADFAL